MRIHRNKFVPLSSARCALWLFLLWCNLSATAQHTYLYFSELPPLPAPSEREALPGLAGAFIGVHNGALIVAGGNNYIGGPSWHGGSRAWHDQVYVLPDKNAQQWLADSSWRLQRPLTNGLSLSHSSGVICIGGNDGAEAHAEVWKLRWDAQTQQITTDSLTPLPYGLTSMAGAIHGNTIYVLGGQKRAATSISETTFLSLDLDCDTCSWRELPSWPGVGRIEALCAAQSDGQHTVLLLAGGRSVSATGNTRYLRDAFTYNLSTGQWQQVASLPPPIVGGQAVVSGGSHVLVFGGHDGSGQALLNQLAAQIDSARTASDSVNELRIAEILRALNRDPKDLPPTTKSKSQQLILLLDILRRDYLDEFPPFNSTIYSYNLITDQWARVGKTTEPVIATSAVWWDGDIVIPSGENKPGFRTPKVWTAKTQPASRLRIMDYGVLVLYLSALLFIGIRLGTRSKSTNDYFKAGGRIPAWAAGLSVLGTALSAITLMGVPASAYGSDWLYVGTTLSQLLVIPIVVALFLPFYRKLDVTTAYEYLEKRFNFTARLLGAVSFVLFQIARISIVLFLPALALSLVSGFNIYLCILITAGVSIVYTVVGGIEAVVWTDVLQVFVLFGGAIVCIVIMIVGTDGGMTSFVDIATEDHKLRLADLALSLDHPTLWVVLGGGLASQLVFHATDQSIVQRYLTTKDLRSAQRGAWTFAWTVIPTAIIFFGLGTALFVFYKQNPADLNPMLNQADAILPWFMVTEVPVGLAGLLVAGIFAASMSTLDSAMNSSATVITSDFYRRLKPNQTDQHYLGIAKAITFTVGLLGLFFAFLMAGLNITSLWDEYIRVLGLFTGGLGGLFLLGMLSRRAHAVGVLTGFVMSGLILFAISEWTSVHFLLYTFVGLASCYVIGWIASVVIPSKPKELAGLTIKP